MTTTSSTTDLQDLVARAYYHEAEQLDARDLSSWLQWVDDGFRYEVPIPVTRDDPRAPQHSSTGYLARETKDSIALWVSRLSPALVDAAYAENPPVRTRHFVSNIRCVAPPQTDRAEGSDYVVTVRSNVLLTWGKWNEPPQFLAGERHDELRESNGALVLQHRTVYLDSNIVHLGHLRILL